MIGSTISHYRVTERLGRGAMGLVYKAQDLMLDRPVAIKFISREIALNLEQRTRFEREARTASLLDHTNICTIHEFGETPEGELYIVMGFCPGENLRMRLERGPLPLKQAVNIAEQVAAGLAKAHSLGVVHRDIKPANIMLLPDGGVKIVDFGLAKLPRDVGLTNTGGVVGTIPYMSPEQLRGDPLDRRTDIWSWGVTFYEMLAGDRPFEAGSEATVMRAIMDLEAPSLSARRPDVPLALDQLIQLTLKKDRTRRPDNAGELVDTLRSLAVRSGSVPVFPVSSRPHASVAVLPFLNHGSDPDSEYFSDGLTEELIYALSRIPGLQVVSRTSAFEFKNKAQNVRTIGEQLKVSAVVEGSVRRIGDRVRVSTQLVNVSDGFCLWSQKFDGKITDIFEVQEEIAQSIADLLKVELGSKIGSSGLVKRYTDNFEAYDFYLRGRFHWNKRSPEGFQKAMEYYQRALELDPKYAPAYAGIADYHVSVASWGLAPPNDAWPQAKEAAEKALEADDTLAEAHASMGVIHMWFEWEWKEAEREFLRAIELTPGLPISHVYYNLLLVQTGRFDEAEEQIREAIACDPLSVPSNVYLAGVYHYRRDYDRSIQQARRALEIDPNDIEAHIVVALNLEQKREYPEAIAELEKAYELADRNPLLLGPLGSCYGGAGEKEKALGLIDGLNEAAKQMYVAPMSWVMLYLGVGDIESAFHWLEKSAEARDILLCYLKVGPIYDQIREDPRYGELLQRINLADDESISRLRTVTQHSAKAIQSSHAGSGGDS
jgi:serine/threonine protein kinase/Tfp pilus assembly protein PilF